MSYAHKLKYAGGDPYEPEQNREDITEGEMEMLEQDGVYQKLAQTRWLAYDLDGDRDVRDALSEEANGHVFRAADIELRQAVDEYVGAWLAEYREEWDVPSGPSEDGSDAAKEVRDE